MDFESNIKYLDILYQTKEITYQLEIHRPIDYYSLMYVELKVLIERALLKSPDKEENADIFIKNIGTILKYTNNFNYEWIYYDILYENPSFIPALKANIGSMRFNHHTCLIITRIDNILKAKNSNEQLLTKEVIEKLIELPISFTVNTYGLIYDKLDEEKRIWFLQKLLDNHKRFRFTSFSEDTYTPRIIEYICQNALEFAKYTTDLFAFNSLVSNSKQTIEKLNSYYKNNPKELAKIIIESMRLDEYTDNIKELVYLIVLDIINNEKATFSDIDWCIGGSYSNVLFIKNKVLKYGHERANWLFPNNPYIMTPLLRKQLSDDNRDLFLEVTEKAEQKEVTEDDMFFIYKGLREIDLIWSDVKKDNVGFLIEDNIKHWNKPIYPTDDMLELMPYRGEKKVLRKGDAVLLDADSIYDLREDYISHNKTKYFDDVFEKRYQKELKKGN